MGHFEVKLDSSLKLLKLYRSNRGEDSSVWDNIQRALFLYCEEISKEEIYLAVLFAQKVLQENPVQFRRHYEDPVVRIYNSLDAVCQQKALKQLLVALERSGNEEKIEKMLEFVQDFGNNGPAAEDEPPADVVTVTTMNVEERLEVTVLSAVNTAGMEAEAVNVARGTAEDAGPVLSPRGDEEPRENVNRTASEANFTAEKDAPPPSVKVLQVSETLKDSFDKANPEKFSTYREKYKLKDVKIILERLPVGQGGKRSGEVGSSKSVKGRESLKSCSSSTCSSDDNDDRDEDDDMEHDAVVTVDNIKDNAVEDLNNYCTVDNVKDNAVDNAEDCAVDNVEDDAADNVADNAVNNFEENSEDCIVDNCDGVAWNLHPRKCKKATIPTVKPIKRQQLIPCGIDGCKTRRRTAETLEIHRKKVHEGTLAPYNCQICSKSFATPGKLERHHKEVHLRLMTCICDRCGRMFARQGDLTDHMVVHSDAKPFRCPHCPMAFKIHQSVQGVL